MNVIGLPARRADDAVIALALAGLGYIYRATYPNEEDIVRREVFHRLAQPVALDKHIVHDEIVARRRQRAERAMEPREQSLAERPKFNLKPAAILGQCHHRAAGALPSARRHHAQEAIQFDMEIEVRQLAL